MGSDIGAAAYPDDGETLPALLSVADRRLYGSAASGSAATPTRYPLLDNLVRGIGRRGRPHVWSTVMRAGEWRV